MNAPERTAAPSVQRDALHFLPLGGAGEIGMNLNLYACQGQWLMVDLGITFAGDTLPGIDVILPDPAFIEERRKDLLAIVLTHAHEDHLGAVAYLWPRLRCPVYATPFAAAVLREKLADARLLLGGAADRGGALQPARSRAVRAHLHLAHPFDPGAERAADRDALRARDAHGPTGRSTRIPWWAIPWTRPR